MKWVTEVFRAVISIFGPLGFAVEKLLHKVRSRAKSHGVLELVLMLGIVLGVGSVLLLMAQWPPVWERFTEFTRPPGAMTKAERDSDVLDLSERIGQLERRAQRLTDDGLASRQAKLEAEAAAAESAREATAARLALTRMTAERDELRSVVSIMPTPADVSDMRQRLESQRLAVEEANDARIAQEAIAAASARRFDATVAANRTLQGLNSNLRSDLNQARGELTEAQRLRSEDHLAANRALDRARAAETLVMSLRSMLETARRDLEATRRRGDSPGAPGNMAVVIEELRARIAFLEHLDTARATALRRSEESLTYLSLVHTEVVRERAEIRTQLSQVQEQRTNLAADVARLHRERSNLQNQLARLGVTQYQ